MDKIKAYIISFIIILIVIIAPYNSMKSIKTPWYQSIKSSITPPNWVFPIVWTILYFILSIVLANTLMLDNSDNKNILLILLLFNLFLNASWSIIFFGKKDINFAFIIILGLIISQIFILNYSNNLLSKELNNGLYLYLLWLCFAGLLNYLSIQKKLDIQNEN